MSIDHNHIKDGIWHDFVPNMFELVQYHLSKWHGIVLSNQDRMLTIAYMRDKKTVKCRYVCTYLEKLFHAIYLDDIKQVQTCLEQNHVKCQLLCDCNLCSTGDKSQKRWHLT